MIEKTAPKSKYKSQIDWGVFAVVFGLGILGTLIAKECDFRFHKAKDFLVKSQESLTMGLKRLVVQNKNSTEDQRVAPSAQVPKKVLPPTFEGQYERAIIGSGPAAIAEAMQQSLEASKVTILSDKKSLQADPDLLKMLKNRPNIVVLNNVEVIDAMETENGRAMYLQYKNKDTGMMFLLPVEEACDAGWVSPEKQSEITAEWIQKHILSELSSKKQPAPSSAANNVANPQSPVAPSITNDVKNQRLPEIKIRAVRRDNSK